MGYVHISKSKGRTIEDFRAVSAKHNAPADIDGLLAWAAGSDENGLHVVTVWQSRAHQERWAAEQLFPAFQEFGMAEDVLANSRVHRVRDRRAVRPLRDHERPPDPRLPPDATAGFRHRGKSGWGHNAGMAERAWSRFLVGVLVLTAVAGASLALAGPTDVARAAAVAGTAAADAKACGTLPSFPAGTANQIMAGQLTIAPFPAVTIDPHRDGDINWAQNPFRNPTWKVDFQNGPVDRGAGRGTWPAGPDAKAYRDRAKALLLGWLSHVLAGEQEPEYLICSAEAFPGQSWIHDRIRAARLLRRALETGPGMTA